MLARAHLLSQENEHLSFTVAKDCSRISQKEILAGLGPAALAAMNMMEEYVKSCNSRVRYDQIECL